MRRFPVLAALLLAAFPAAAHATWPGSAGKIAYTGVDVDDEGVRDGIYVVGASGKGNHRILRNAGDVAWSRDGRRIAFVRADREVWEAASDGSGARRIARLPSGTVSDPAWSPSGKRLLFARAVRRRGPDRYEIWMVRRSGDGVRKLTAGLYATWSSRGLIAFATPNGALVTMRPDGRGRRIWVPQGSPFSAVDLDFSPDGRRLVYKASYLEIERDAIRTLDLRTGATMSFPAWRKHGYILDVAWVPGGRRLAYVFQRTSGDNASLRTVQPSGAGRRTRFRFNPLVSPFSVAWQAR